MSPHSYEMMNRDPFESDRTLERADTGQLHRLEFIYGVNATLLICHEIDSAYWREWELFRIPGGASMFVALHIPLIAIVLWGLILTARQSHAWRWYSLLLSLAGIGGGLVHLAFLFTVNEIFATHFSSTLIGAFFLTSIMQLTMTLRSWSILEKETSTFRR